jgi:hypothetical protein
MHACIVDTRGDAQRWEVLLQLHAHAQCEQSGVSIHFCMQAVVLLPARGSCGCRHEPSSGCCTRWHAEVLPDTACTTSSLSLLDASSSSRAGTSPVNCCFLKRLPITVFFSSRTARSLMLLSEDLRHSSSCWQDCPVPFLATMAMCCCSRNRLQLRVVRAAADLPPNSNF